MDKSREHGKRIEDLPVEAEQAAEVKGGRIDPYKSFVDPNTKSIVDPNNKSIIDPNN